MEQLGDAVRAKVGEMRVGDVDFEESEEIDPRRYGPCSHW